jgi:hypothetical protein
VRDDNESFQYLLLSTPLQPTLHLGAALATNAPFLEGKANTWLAFDELIAYPDYKDHEMKALHEFLLANPHVEGAVVGQDGRPYDGPELRFYEAEEAQPHRVLIRLTPRKG